MRAATSNSWVWWWWCMDYAQAKADHSLKSVRDAVVGLKLDPMNMGGGLKAWSSLHTEHEHQQVRLACGATHLFITGTG